MRRGVEEEAGSWLASLASRGFTGSVVRVLSNGLQAEVSDPDRTCRVNLYSSEKRGFSTVYSGGDRDLFGELTVRSDAAGGTGGSDEAGKGDYFGPLVVAAVLLDPDSAARLRASGLADSKLLDHRRISMLEEAILKETGCRAVVSMEPSEYNSRMESMPRGSNSLDILARMHAEAISGMLACGRRPERTVIDRFCAGSRILPLLPRGQTYELRIHGEAEPAVAAASVLARAAYVRAVRSAAAELGVGLKPGAGADIDRIGAEAVSGSGPEILRRIAKYHFANTGRILRMAGY